ncbi:BON domain-containing protein [Dehalobacter sp. DCM]|uniref:BON domain-containing protein n=1 Tax=Dehalobacter sp. DCM TaxID=2907827 RepID=UPI0030820DC9|nr:BON domain-containing protein [Dehalobacter sp. DCM]
MSNSKDIELKNSVEAAIEKDEELGNRYAIHVDVIEEEVQLLGVVDTLSEKERLERFVKNIPGVVHVSNGLTISTDGLITDRGVEFEVAEELQADPRVDTKHIGAKSYHGSVHLVGRSDDKDEIKAAANAASRARGVKRVISEVHPVSHDREKDVFHSQVRNDGD